MRPNKAMTSRHISSGSLSSSKTPRATPTGSLGGPISPTGSNFEVAARLYQYASLSRLLWWGTRARARGRTYMEDANDIAQR